MGGHVNQQHSAANPLSDTPKGMEEVQFALFRKMEMSERFRRTCLLSDWVIRLSKDAIREAHRHLSAREADLFFVETHYGKELAQKVRRYLNQNG